MNSIRKLLIANRGEIACRVMRTASRLGIQTVAVYTDADANAPHEKMADEAVHIGPSPVNESYLRADKIIEAARQTGADAIHPGYGFLSENDTFAEAVEKAGIIFVGPPANAIRVMGDKARSKRAMLDADVPCIPGYQDEDQSDAALIKASKGIGYPLMVKAAAGGGGRGMRFVDDAANLSDAIKLARSEAENAFGSGELILEKAIVDARHVEVQVFGDKHGNVIHLGERDCSVQRRHQKVVEEAPCPVMTPELRAAMGKAAVEAARAVDYVGAGTVEFLLGPDGNFYFLEMNTRLQVEHPVTELVTGLDLVELQLKVAEGEPLSLDQSDVHLNGHAIEIRLYAEDPEADFLPSTGSVNLFNQPTGEGIRVDTGIETGGEVSPFYDPMVAKIISYGANRDAARRKLIRALSETGLIGPKNNRDFLIDVLSKSKFSEGAATTSFIADEYGSAGFKNEPLSDQDYALAAALQHVLAQRSALKLAPKISNELLNWGSSGHLFKRYVYEVGGEKIPVGVLSNRGSALNCSVQDVEFKIAVRSLGGSSGIFEIDGSTAKISFHEDLDGTLHISTPKCAYSLRDISGGESGDDEVSGGGVVTAPMHGKLLEIFVKEGASVKTGVRLAILEAMKMQHEILAEVDGEVVLVASKAGDQIAADDLILEIKPVEDA